MGWISEQAIVETVRIGAGVRIAEFSVIRGDVTIGDSVVIHPHVVIESGVTIGDNVEIFPGAYIGKVPKGAGALTRAPTFVARIEIGDNCSIGPHVVVFYDVVVGAVTVNYNTRIGSGVRVQDHTWQYDHRRRRIHIRRSRHVERQRDGARPVITKRVPVVLTLRAARRLA